MRDEELRQLERMCRRFPISQTHPDIVAYLKRLREAINAYLSEIREA